MQPTESFEVRVPQEIMAVVHKAVEAGEYPSNNDVILAALLQWQAWHDQPLQNVEELRALCEAGEASGDAEPFTVEELLDQLKNNVPDRK